MEKYFLSYDLASEIEKLGFNESCLGRWIIVTEWENPTGEIIFQLGREKDNNNTTRFQYIAPLYQQVIDWFEKEHNIFIGRTCYDDGKTPKRWVYHVDSYYVQEQSYDGAIRYAINKIIIKEK
jgi:tRNA A37 threonylcarbamoyladenosine biosynthesis protein TsaE